MKKMDGVCRMIMISEDVICNKFSKGNHVVDGSEGKPLIHVFLLLLSLRANHLSVALAAG